MKIYRLLLLLSSWAHKLTALNVAILLTCLIAVALVGYAVYLCRKEEKGLKLAACLMLWIGAVSLCAFQTHTFAALDTANLWTGSNTFSGTTTVSLLDKLVFADAYGMKCDGVTNDTASLNSAITAATGTRIVVIPPGTCLANITINTGGQANVTFRGFGSRTTLFKPATNAAVFTLDSSSTAVQNVVFEDLGFDNTGSGFAQPAIQIQGSGINDYHKFSRLYMTGFKDSINIIGPTIWDEFDNLQIRGDTDIGLRMVSSCAGGNFIGYDFFYNVSVDNSASHNVLLNCTSGQSAKMIFDGLDAETGGGNGFYCTGTGCDALTIENSYFETNTGNAIKIDASFARGFHIVGNYIHTANTSDQVVVSGGQDSGEIKGNFIAAGASGNTISISGQTAVGMIDVGGNFDTGPHNFAADGGTSFHAASTGAYPSTNSSVSGTTTLPAVQNGQQIYAYRFTNTSALTLTNLTSGDPGQVVYLVNEGTNTVTLQWGNTSGFYNSQGNNLVLSNGDSAVVRLEPANGRWMEYPSFRTIGSGTATMTTAGIATGACGTTVTVASTGVLTTDVINATRNAAVTIGNGGGLTLNAWPTAGNVNFNYCNSAAGTITPTAMTINWQVTR